MQVESHFVFVNSRVDNSSKRDDYANKLAQTMHEFVERWYDFLLTP